MKGPRVVRVTRSVAEGVQTAPADDAQSLSSAKGGGIADALPSARTPSANGRRSRRKGATFERECAALLRSLYPDAKRGFQSRSGRDGCDVEGSPFWVECKHGKLVNLRAALAQAVADTDGRPPLVVAKDDRTEPVVLMRLSDFLALLSWRPTARLARANCAITDWPRSRNTPLSAEHRELRSR